MSPVRVAQFWIFLLICSWLSLSPAPPQALLSVSDKLLHAAGYCALYLSVRLAYPAPVPRSRLILTLLGYSILIEVLQHFIPNRGFSLLDILANAGGLFLGFCVATILSRTQR